MGPDLTDTLCTKCGLCCDGSLFADVELAGHAEATRVELLGLRVDEDDDRPLLLQPCVALKGTRCSVYAHRPKCCRTFECKLLQEARRGAVGVAQAIETIAQARAGVASVRALIAKLDPRVAALPLAEASAEALAGSTDQDDAGAARRLDSEMTRLQRLIRQQFLG